LTANQPRRGGAGGFVACRHLRGSLVNSAVHRCIIARISGRDRVDYRLGLLRGRGTIEIMPARDGRELVAHVQRGVDPGFDVHSPSPLERERGGEEGCNPPLQASLSGMPLSSAILSRLRGRGADGWRRILLTPASEALREPPRG